ncbi:hypothetical protein [Pseudomonas sp. TUM22785]|uniref:hypothetical protein n=1 Tax=Pseudomonas sp. TUM22785 TaxID=3019098 RepID=UPI0023055DF3|nr:hypothetical protein [Pseudomonas sp. TUM22785]WCD77995.1 hypothetical protein PI990_18515 [Pseudomonas sp. TUM22785]
MHDLSDQRSFFAHYSRCVFIGVAVLVGAVLLSACGNGGRNYISPEEKKCIEYTKKAIAVRGEDYSRYTDKALDDGEPVWVAGRRFDFGYVRPESGGYKSTFRNSDVWVHNGKFQPGVTLIYRESVVHMKERMPGVILSNIDPGNPRIIIKMDCRVGVAPFPERYLSFDRVFSQLMGGPSTYSLSLNKELGFYQALGQGSHAFDYFYMHRNGAVDMSFPAISCGKSISAGICSAKITAWNNIVLLYRFPRRQLSDFTRIYQATKGNIDAALAKGEG